MCTHTEPAYILDNALNTIPSSRDSSVGRGAGYDLDGRGLIPDRVKIVLFSAASRPALGPNLPLVQWVLGAFSLWVKRPGSEADHSPPSSAEVKNGGVIPPLPHISSWHIT
jgi:hypothetical protein